MNNIEKVFKYRVFIKNYNNFIIIKKLKEKI